jgi:patatin-like phospholipase/acyl hydrolase
MNTLGLRFADFFVDGGGIRGYATLRIINDIMSQIRAQEKEEGAALRNFHSITDYDREQDPLTTKNPLPCHYFDYIVGTSTGGYASSPVLLTTKLLIRR